MSGVAIIIPARFNSSRFPGKSLEMIDEFNVIQTVYLVASRVNNADKVIVVTDDKRIAESVESVGGLAIISQGIHDNGTSRIAEIANGFSEYEYVVNLQGDEPFINSKDVEVLIENLKKGQAEIVTLIKNCNEEEFHDPNCVKVVIGLDGRALYFSRASIPFRSTESSNYKHIGIYGFQRKTLLELVTLEPTLLEISERLEQLRWIENGYSIQTVLTDHESIGIDVPSDLVKAKAYHRSNSHLDQ